MIISASRRTDIPCYYSDWFFNRLNAGFAYVRNPVNPHLISEVALTSDVVDGIVFWTKNPTPMLDKLDELQKIPYYFQFTLTPYGTDVEQNVPSKNDVIIPAFRKLASIAGKERVVWRYDPILLNEKYTMAYHIKYFRALCDKLADSTEKCTVSFLDLYRKIQHSIAPLAIRPPTVAEIEDLMGHFSETAQAHGLRLDTCAEEIDLSKYGVGHAACIDRDRLERIGNCKLHLQRDPNQRTACGCAAAVDLGAYNTCKNGCVYCYANYNQKSVNECCAMHDPASPLLFGQVGEQDVIKLREMKSLRDDQLRLF